MALLTLVLTTLALGSAIIYLLLKWSDSRIRDQMATRNVRYIRQSNPLWTVFRKERTEVTNYETLKRERTKVFGFSLFNSYTILCSDPDIAGTVLSKEFTSFTNRRVSGSFLNKNKLSILNSNSYRF